jgi:Na+/H+-dicarboxylate symporter
MPKLSLSHFEAAILFSVFTSVVLGIVTKRSDRERLTYGVKCFGYFLLALVAIGWVMRLGHG